MRKSKVSKIWIPAFLLAVVMAGCNDADKSGGPTSPTAPHYVKSVDAAAVRAVDKISALFDNTNGSGRPN